MIDDVKSVLDKFVGKGNLTGCNCGTFIIEVLEECGYVKYNGGWNRNTLPLTHLDTVLMDITVLKPADGFKVLYRSYRSTVHFGLAIGHDVYHVNRRGCIVSRYPARWADGEIIIEGNLCRKVVY